jgi:D-3-phosphoglycerate dehydrogenase / 2-oxoglutarate reductase
MNKKVFVSNFPFARFDKTPLEILERNGISYELNSLGRKLKPSETASLAKDFEVIIAGTEDLLPLVESSFQLKMISRIGIGLDNVPIELCQSKNIKVTYTPDAVTPAVSEFTIGLMLDGIRKISFSDREIRKGEWTRPYGTRIGKSIVGIIGLGRVGASVARLLSSFHPQEILVNDILDVSDKILQLQKVIPQIRFATKEEIYQNADIITLHVPKTQHTVNLITSKEIGIMKKTTVLINTSRGSIINENDLEEALRKHQIGFACLDVFAEEPYLGPLKNLENITLTQHIGSCSEDCRADMEREATEEVVRFLRNENFRNLVV